MKTCTANSILLDLVAWGILFIGIGGAGFGQSHLPQTAEKSPHSVAENVARVIFQQDLSWDDALDSGQYLWGQDGFLKMDGSQSRIACRHRLKRRIVDKETRLALTALFVPGRAYRIALFNSLGSTVASATVKRDGHISLGADLNTKETDEPELSCGPGVHCQPPPGGGAHPSPLHVLGFSSFDFHAGTAVFTLDGKAYPGMALERSAKDIDGIEVETLTVDAGSVVWIHDFKEETSQGEVDESLRFPREWTRNVAVIPGYPSDKWQETTYRPKDFKWLEMKTHYGAVYLRFSDTPIRRGVVELQIMADSMEEEVQVNLGKYRYDATGTNGYLPVDSTGISTISGGWNADAGVYDGAWTPFLELQRNEHPSLRRPYPIFQPFDNAPSAEAGRRYKLKIAWDVAARSYRVWIDGAPQTFHGSPSLPMSDAPETGLDMLMIHAGDLNLWRGPVLRARWGEIKIVAE